MQCVCMCGATLGQNVNRSELFTKQIAHVFIPSFCSVSWLFEQELSYVYAYLGIHDALRYTVHRCVIYSRYDAEMMAGEGMNENVLTLIPFADDVFVQASNGVYVCVCVFFYIHFWFLVYVYSFIRFWCFSSGFFFSPFPYLCVRVFIFCVFLFDAFRFTDPCRLCRRA